MQATGGRFGQRREIGESDDGGACHDLQAEGFDPVLPAGEEREGASLPSTIDLHCREIVEADGIVIVHPNWWDVPPAILTGWID